ncbi:MAG: YceI family protein [Candidatus Sericytochromatia bacterium]|nr:YceI family protein [Candidatus Sericytochromatia bacterium]
MRHPGPLLALLLAAGPAVAAPASYVFGRDVRTTYRVVHPLHVSVGTSDQMQGTVRVLDASQATLELPLRLRVPVRSFRSGNRSRDRNMALVMQADRHPVVELVLDSVVWRERRATPDGLSLVGEAAGKVQVRGVQQPVRIALSGRLRPDVLTVEASFPISLDAHGVERPSLMLRPVDDEVLLSVEATATVLPPA